MKRFFSFFGSLLIATTIVVFLVSEHKKGVFTPLCMGLIVLFSLIGASLRGVFTRPTSDNNAQLKLLNLEPNKTARRWRYSNGKRAGENPPEEDSTTKH